MHGLLYTAINPGLHVLTTGMSSVTETKYTVVDHKSKDPDIILHFRASVVRYAGYVEYEIPSKWNCVWVPCRGYSL